MRFPWESLTSKTSFRVLAVGELPSDSSTLLINSLNKFAMLIIEPPGSYYWLVTWGTLRIVQYLARLFQATTPVAFSWWPKRKYQTVRYQRPLVQDWGRTNNFSRFLQFRDRLPSCPFWDWNRPRTRPRAHCPGTERTRTFRLGERRIRISYPRWRCPPRTPAKTDFQWRFYPYFPSSRLGMRNGRFWYSCLSRVEWRCQENCQVSWDGFGIQVQFKLLQFKA